MAELSPETEALMLAYVYGEMSESASASFEEELSKDPALRAEVDGLLATRELLDLDVRYGEQTGLDAPPAHLREAIFRAEALARPAALRDAHLQRAAPETPAAPLLHRLSTWILGGGIALGAAAAVLIVVSGDRLNAPAEPLSSVASKKQASFKNESRATGTRKVDAETVGAAEAQKPMEQDEGRQSEPAPLERPARRTDLQDEMDDARRLSASRGAKSVAAPARASSGRGAPPPAAPSMATRDDLDAPAIIDASKGSTEGVRVILNAPTDKATAGAQPQADAEEHEALVKEQEGAQGSIAQGRPARSSTPFPPGDLAPRSVNAKAKGRRASARDRSDRFSAAPPALPGSVSEATRETAGLTKKKRYLNAKRAPAAAGTDMMELKADRASNDAMQAGDAMMKRGRYDDAIALYLSAAVGRPANETRMILARYIEACHRAKRDQDALSGWRQLDRLMKNRKVVGDIRKAYDFAAQSAERLGDQKTAARIRTRAPRQP